MSKCTRCGAAFTCGMADGSSAACWCTALPPAVPLPEASAGCWCPACLTTHIAELSRTNAHPDLANKTLPTK